MFEPILPDSIDDVRLDDITFWSRREEEREGAFALLRRERPVSFHKEFEPPPQVPLPQGPGYWAITRHADILEASRRSDLFCSGKGIQIPDLPEELNEFFGSMIAMDDPRHARLRRIVSRGFTPRSLGRIEDEVQSRAVAVIDRVIDRGECDFVSDIAAALPLEIICNMMGIPASQRQFVFDHTNTILGLGDPEYVKPGENPLAAALNSGKALADLMNEIAKERRKTPKDDLTSQLLNAEIESEALSDQEIASFFVLLVAAGNETTRNAISHGMLALGQHPDERRRWAEDFEAVAPTAVEEIVRWASPVIHFRRTATEDTQLGGQKIAAGEKIVLWYNSANRDEAVFEDPFRFDVTRTPNEHVGYGGPGVHHCLGANLARREITVMFRELLRRLPDLEITGPPERLLSNFIHGIKRMPCAFTPGGAA
ncbi:MAG: cytochrome P450 [Deltaproteobacteria bacterium]|nr:cytochrome P450 [Deltaproteobacteria bacterium]